MDITSLKWIGHASFLTEISGKNVYIDPFMLNGITERADIIFATHSHFDHLNMDDIRKIADKNTSIVVPSSSIEEVNIGKPFGVEPNKSYEIKGIKFSTVPAYNIVKERLNNHPRKNNWVGYIIESDIGSIYHPGDTDFINEMKNLKTDIALLPMGGTYTMDVSEAIEAAKSINAKIAIPMHYKALLGAEGSKSAEARFVNKVKNSIILKEIIEPRYSFQ